MSSFEQALGPHNLGGEVLVRIARGRHSGVLTWTEHGAECKVTFNQGRPQLAVLGGAQRMDKREQISGIVRDFAVVTSGSCNFEASDQNVEGAPAIDTMGEVLMAFMRVVKPKQLEGIWNARGGYQVSATNAFDQLAGAINRLGGPQLRKPLPNTAAGTLIAGAPEEAQRGWAALLVLGGLSVVNRPAPIQAAIRPQTQRTERETRRTTRESEPIGMSTQVAKLENPRARVAYRDIQKAHTDMQDKTHYEVLGVDQGASIDTVRKAYFELAKKWHSDRLRELGLDDDTLAKAEELFAMAEEANRVLSDDEERKTYDYVLDRRDRGLPTDPKVIMEAEGLFRKAQTLVRRGQAAAAEPILREAISLNKGEAEFHVYFGFALYGAKGQAALEEATAEIEKGLAMNENLDSAHEFLGRIARVEGNNKAAEKHLRRALQINPKNTDAERELRFIQMRQTGKHRAKKKGGLGGLFGKKK